jgi:undecaprenyl-diphosphatase
MTTFQAIILGIIQGLTEFLPISSTAHLRIIPALVGWPDPGAAFTAVIQWGTWVACVIYFRHDIVRLLLAFLAGLRSGRPLGTQDSRLAWMIVVGTLPIVVFGLLLEKHVKGPFRSLYVIAAAAIGLALVMLAAETLAARRRREGTDLEALSWGESLLVGFAQVLAIIPGASRSGVTITGGLFAGLTRATAARFSFLLSLPAVFGAGLHQLYKERAELLASQESVLHLVVATVVSGVVGYAAIAFLIAYLRQHTMGLFIVYRLALGVLLLVLLAQGALQPNEGQPDRQGDARSASVAAVPER